MTPTIVRSESSSLQTQSLAILCRTVGCTHLREARWLRSLVFNAFSYTRQNGGDFSATTRKGRDGADQVLGPRRRLARLELRLTLLVGI